MHPSEALYNTHTQSSLVLLSSSQASAFTQHHSTVPLFIYFFAFCVFFLMSPCVVLSPGRSAAPDLHRLNEDGELWLVNQGLKETIRCNLKCVNINAGALLASLLPRCLCLLLLFYRGHLFIHLFRGGGHQTNKVLLSVLCSTSEGRFALLSSHGVFPQWENHCLLHFEPFYLI